MEIFLPDKIITLLCIGTTFSVVEMAFVQKIKMLPIFNKDYKISLLNLAMSFLLGIPFGMHFFQIPILDAIWVALFGFIGSPAIYATLKNQNIINYTPQATQKASQKVAVASTNNQIKSEFEITKG